MRVSLIVSVYKNVENLKVILQSLKFQSFKNFEVIVSEDGEDSEMKSFLHSPEYPFLVMHAHQPDVGWRKSQALNNAISKSTGEYLVFIDGDCIPHHKFIESHLYFAQPKTILAGKRVKLGVKYSKLFKDRIADLPSLENKFFLHYLDMIKDKGQFLEHGLYVNPESLTGRIFAKKKFRTMKGCNMSFYKKDLIEINGFDEDYKRPGVGEDLDLEWRFTAAGCTLKCIKYFAIQYHLHHNEHYNEIVENAKIMNAKRERNEYICKNGIRKLS